MFIKTPVEIAPNCVVCSEPADRALEFFDPLGKCQVPMCERHTQEAVALAKRRIARTYVLIVLGFAVTTFPLYSLIYLATSSQPLTFAALGATLAAISWLASYYFARSENPFLARAVSPAIVTRVAPFVIRTLPPTVPVLAAIVSPILAVPNTVLLTIAPEDVVLLMLVVPLGVGMAALVVLRHWSFESHSWWWRKVFRVRLFMREEGVTAELPDNVVIERGVASDSFEDGHHVD